MNDALKIENNDIMNKFQKTENILNDVQNIIEVSQKEAYRAVNTILSQRNWLIGYRIAEEELAGEDLTLFGYNGNVPARFIKKVTTSGDRWNKDNGTTTYRYVTDSKGYVVQIYSKWESAQGKTDAEEKLECEIIYE